MMKKFHPFLFALSLLFVYTMLYFTFEQKAIFWYLYAFTLLVCIAVATVYGEIRDELPTWQYLLFGIGYGTITYMLVKLGYMLLPLISDTAIKQIDRFLATYSPTSIWHYLLLIFIIVVGEEIFWRGFVQQQLKRWLSTPWAIMGATILFSLSLALSGFFPGVLAALVAGLIFGALYEWKKSLPLTIVAHVVFVVLLFLVLPLTS